MNRDVLFLWIPKGAGHSVFSELRKRGGKHYRLNRRPYMRDFRNDGEHGITTFGHASVKALLDNRVFRDQFLRRAYVFTFIRNPWDRLVSIAAYYASGLRPGPKPRFGEDIQKNVDRLCKKIRKREIDSIGFFHSKGLSSSNPQVTWIDEVHRFTEMSYIGRYETLGEDWRKVCRDLGWEENPLPKLNVSRHRDYRSYYSSETRDIVGEYYREDILRFGYKF